jgi:hypothetical protein
MADRSMKGGGAYGIRYTQEIRQEEKIDLLDIRRKVKGALSELHLALRTLDKLTEKE